MRFGTLSSRLALVWFAAMASGINGDAHATEEFTESDSPKTDAPVEEFVVYGVRTGDLPDISGASVETLFTADYVGENKSLADLLSETEGLSIRRFGGAGDRTEVTIRGSTPSA